MGGLSSLVPADVPALGGDREARLRLLQEALPDWISAKDGEIFADGLSLRTLAETFGTPAWIVSLSRLEENYRQLHDAVTRYRRAELAYSIKANNNRAVIETLAAAGSFFDCSSEYEVWAALRAGVGADRLILNGGGKSAAFLRYAVEAGIGQVNIDSYEEVRRVAALAEEADRPVNCALRIRPDYTRLLEQDPTYDPTLRIGEGKFGIAVAGGEALAAARLIEEHPNLRLRGLSHHAGFPGYRVPYAGERQLMHHRECIRSMCEFAGLLRDRLGVEIEAIDVGGGLRSGPRVLLVAAGRSEDAEIPTLPSADDYARNLDEALSDHLPAGLDPKLQLECGGYIVMDAVALLTTVVEVKDDPNPRRWVTVDAHMMQFASRAMTRIGSPVVHSGSPAGRPFDDIPVDLVGQTCNYDALAEGLRMASVASGDLLLLTQHGAYMEVSGTQFNGVPRPAVVAVRGAAAALARRRETVEDVFGRDRELPPGLHADGAADGGATKVGGLEQVRRRLAAAPEASRLQPIGLREIAFGQGALERLPALLEEFDAPREGKRTVLIVDGTPVDRAGEQVVPLVERLVGQRGAVERVLLRGGGRAHADEETIAAAVAAAAGGGAVVSIGSGTLVDIGKVVAAEIGPVPHVVVQTAASVNGFADNQAVLVIDGVKRTVAGEWPDALIMDEDVLAGAPAQLTRAGVGDSVPMYTAPADWKLAGLVGQDDSYAPTLIELLHEQGATIGEIAGEVGRREPGGSARLAWILAVGGLVMGVAGRTAPGSGMEHLVSHLLEMRAVSRGAGDPWHGAKVGVATVLASLVWRRTLDRVSDLSSDQLRFPSEEEMEARVLAAFAPLDTSGEAAAECWRAYRQKLALWHAKRDEVRSLVADWTGVSRELRPLLAPPEAIVETLRAADAPTRFSELTPAIGGDDVRWALSNCHLMRERFTIADLATFAGGWEQADVDAVLDEARALGAGL